MLINYEENELINLFKTNPIYIHEKEVILLLSQKEDIILEHKLKKVERLLSEENCLRIHQSDEKQDILIQFTPNILVRYWDN